MISRRWKRTFAVFPIAATLLLVACHGSNARHTADDGDNTAAAKSAPPSVIPAAAVDPGPIPSGDPIVGCYQWFNNVAIVIGTDHTIAGGGITGTWQLVSAAQRAYQFTWPKSIDTVTIMANQQSLSGMNQYGYSVSGTRIAGSSGLEGTWQWTYSVPLIVPPVIVDPAGTYSAGTALGTWQAIDALRGTYALTWSDPPRDSVTLSADGSRISGADQWGLTTSGTRTASCAGGTLQPKETPASALPTRPRPPKLVQMLTYARAVDPSEAWEKGIRTLTPFDCKTPQSGIVRCQTTFARVGQDGPTGYLDVMIYDHDVSFEKEYTDIQAMTPAKGDQAAFFTQTDLTYTDVSSGTRKTNRSECKQEIGTTGNSQENCFVQFDGSTELVAGVKASHASTAKDGGKAEANEDSGRAFDILILGTDLLRNLWAVPQSPAGEYKEEDITNTYGRIMFSGPGWYVQRNDIFLIAVFGGPYTDQKSCLEDLPRAAASAKAQGDMGYEITECAYFQKEP
jgi:hypothetical protein